jgi:hypothetical protein
MMMMMMMMMMMNSFLPRTLITLFDYAFFLISSVIPVGLSAPSSKG